MRNKPIKCEFEMNYYEIFCWRSNFSNDDIISVFVNMHVAFCHFLQVWKLIWILEVWSENGCGKWHFWVWNRVRTLRTGRHTPTKNSQEYPLPLPGRMSPGRCPHSTSVTQESAEQIKIDVSRATNHDKLAPPSSAVGYWCCRIAISIGIPSRSLCRGERTTQLSTI